MKTSTEAITVPIEMPDRLETGNNGFESRKQAPRNDATEWMWLLWERRRFLGRTTLWGLVLSTAIAFLIPKRYESTTRLMPPDQSGSGLAMMAAMAGAGTGGGASGLSSLAGDLLGMKSSGALFVDILQSRTVEDRLIERFNLLKVYHDRYMVDGRKDLARLTAIAEDRKSGVITIQVTDWDPHRAAALASAYVEELDRLVAEVSTSSARRERIFIEQRLKTVKADLDNASRQFSEYASQNTTIDLTAQAKATVEAAASLEGQLIAAQSELDGLEQIYTNNNVRVRSLQARVDELRNRLHDIGGDTSPGKSSSGQEFPSIRQLPLLGVKWADLYRETKIQETVYQLLTQQYEVAKIQEAKEIPTVKVLDEANLPEKKSFPPRFVLCVLGAMLSFALAAAYISGGKFWRGMDPSDSRKLLAQEAACSLVKSWRGLRTRFASTSRGNR